MKPKKILSMLLLVAVLLTGFTVSAAERKLTLDRAVQINDTQIILEFSEPIAINKYQENVGPFTAIRLLTDGQPTRINDIKSLYYGEYLQWAGNLEYVDSKHDRLVWTIYQSAIGIDTIEEIRNYVGELANYKHLPMALTVEEYPYDTDHRFVDNAICNVTTRDGAVNLTPTLPSGWEKCNMFIEVDYSYPVDLSATESVVEGISFDRQLLFRGSEINGEDPMDEPVTLPEEPMLMLKNEPWIIAAILGGSVVMVVLWFVIALIVRKKRKGV